MKSDLGVYISDDSFNKILDDLAPDHEKILKTGMETCPWCGRSVPTKEMTSSVSRGTVCWDCDMELSKN